MSINYHMEALRQQRKIDRAFAARERMEKQSTSDSTGVLQACAEEGLVIAEPGQYDLSCCEPLKLEPLQKFRLNEEGFNIRYRGRQNLAPHCDEAYQVLPPPAKYPLRIFHRHARKDNIPEDKMYPIIHPKDKNFKIPDDFLPPRKPHFKV